MQQRFVAPKVRECSHKVNVITGQIVMSFTKPLSVRGCRFEPQSDYLTAVEPFRRNTMALSRVLQVGIFG